MTKTLLSVFDRPMIPTVVMMVVGIAMGYCVPQLEAVGIRAVFLTLFLLMGVSMALHRFKYFSTVMLLMAVAVYGVFVASYNGVFPDSFSRAMPWLDTTEDMMLEQRESLAEIYRRQGLKDDEYAVAAAMTLGDRSAVSHELKEVYSRSGAAHVFAVSGLHLGIIWGLVGLLLPRRIYPRLTSLVQISVLWCYAFLVGFHPSVLRAVMMLSVYSFCGLLSRRTDSLSSLFFTAFLILSFAPSWLFDVGFQMSFMATLGIILMCGWLFSLLPEQPLKKRNVLLDKGLKWLWGVVSVSIAAQIAVAPLIALYFKRVSLYFLLTNIIVSPAAVMVICLSFSLLLLVSLSAVPLLGWLASHVVTPLLRCTVSSMNAYLEWVVSLPYSTIDDIHINAPQTFLLYVVITCLVLVVRILLKRTNDITNIA